MFFHMKIGRIQIIFACMVGAALLACTNGYISREDMYWMASTSPEIRVTQNDVEIPDGTGSFDFGSVEVYKGLTYSFTIYNEGDQALFISGAAIELGDSNHFDLDVSGLSSCIEPGAGSSFTISFLPLKTGPLSATVVLQNNDLDESSYSFAVIGEGTGTASPQPEIQVLQGGQDLQSETATYKFGTVQQNSESMPVVFTVRNSGNADLQVDDISVSDSANFGIDDASLPAVLGPGEEGWFSMTFTPTSTGNISAIVSIANNDGDESPFTFTVTGTGDANGVQDIAVSCMCLYVPAGTGRYDFGTVEVGQYSPKVTFTIQNPGTATLEVERVYLSSGDPAQYLLDSGSTSKTVPAGGSTSFTITFNPAETGSITALVAIDTNDPDTFEDPYTFSVSGAGSIDPVPDILLFEDTCYPPGSWYDFGSWKIGQKSSVKIYIENPGTASLEITNVLLTDGDQEDFTLDLTKTAFAVPAGKSTYFSATFAPTTSGERTRMLEIRSNDPDVTDYVISLKGFGQ